MRIFPRLEGKRKSGAICNSYFFLSPHFEGRCATNLDAQFGRSKEKGSDCPLATLGLVLDGDGFPLS
jgi:hypothetical protein